MSASTSQDFMELHELTSSTHSGDSFDPTLMYKTAEYNFLPDQNNLQYTSGRILYDSLPLLNQWVVWADSYLAIPLQVQSSGVNPTPGDPSVPYTQFDPIAFKTSALSLISGLLVQSGDGQTLVNDPQNIQYINNIRALLDTTLEGLDNVENIQLWPDSSTQAFQAAAGAVPGVGFWGTSTARASNNPCPFVYTANNITGNSTTYNEGFSKRIQLWKANSQFAAGVFSMILTIPLAFIHPFFKALDFPVCNARFLITFYSPVTNSTSAITTNPPLLCGLQAVDNTHALDLPRVQIASSTEGPTGVTFAGTRIYYKKVTFDPHTAELVASKMAQGFSRKLQFNLTDYYQLSTSYEAGNGAVTRQYNDVVTPSVVAPVRLWIVSVPHGFSTSNTIPFVSIDPITDANVLVNNSPYYQNNLQLDEQFFDALREQSAQRGKTNTTMAGLIDFKNFRINYRLYCFDLSRLGERLRDPTAACSLIARFSAKPSVGTADYDRFYLVERSQVVTMNMSNASVTFQINSAYNN